jgi:hypothetical protein
MISKCRLYLTALAAASTAMLIGCNRGVHGGNPALPLSTTNGTMTVFPASESAVLNAISNAFAISNDKPTGYRGMDLSNDPNFAGTNFHVANGYILFPLLGPITNVPLTGIRPKSVPYTACFNITTKPLGNTNTAVTVRTVFSKVTDGEEASIHIVGWANHERDVLPVKAEEENVMDAISNALVALP